MIHNNDNYKLYPLELFDTITKSKLKIETIKEGEIKFYVCGPTVYDFVHLGNARSFVFYDLFFKLCRTLYNNVTYVRNITDIDDKIIAKARAANCTEAEISQKYTEFFHKATQFLNCDNPTHEPKVSENIDGIVEIINNLLKRGFAYVSGGDVFFEVEKYKNYGALSGRKQEEMLAGARLEIDKNKKNPNDFVLWKGLPKTALNKGWQEISFQATFYTPQPLVLNGRPGWHIECSAMSRRYLGENFDIHGGGIDSQFPHHENEIAQSVCAFDNCSYAKYWVHNGFLMINGSKMSKSENNFITIEDLIKQNHHGEVVRFAILQTHYNKPLDFTDSLMINTKKILDKFYLVSWEYFDDFDKIYQTADQMTLFNLMPQLAKQAITNDLNVSKYIAIMHTLVNDIKNTTNDPIGRKKTAFEFIAMGRFIGILLDKRYHTNQINNVNSDESNYFKALEIANKRIEGKKLKNYHLADVLRTESENLGYKIIDLPNGEFNLQKI